MACGVSLHRGEGRRLGGGGGPCGTIATGPPRPNDVGSTSDSRDDRDDHARCYAYAARRDVAVRLGITRVAAEVPEGERS